MATMFASPHKSLVWLTLLGSLLIACAPEPESYRATLPAFGTLLNLTLPGDSSQDGDEIVRRVEAELVDLHSRWHAWKPGELSDLNGALAQGMPFEVSQPLLQLILTSRSAYDKSQGLFDPAAGGLIRMWGFHTDHYPVQSTAPVAEQIRAWVSQGVNFDQLKVAGNTVSATSHLVQLDFGAIAKGAALERLSSLLEGHGVSTALLDFGGDVGALGSMGPDGWRVAIRHPSGPRPIATALLNTGEYIMTSGTYARFREDDGQPHLLNPRSGLPAAGLVSATVLNRSGSLADAAATALVIAGPDQWSNVADAMGVGCALVVHEDGRVVATEVMNSRLTASNSNSIHVVPTAAGITAC